MSKYRDIFPNKAFLPVVHVQNYSQASKNVETALECGADGVFLINHEFGPDKLMEIYGSIRKSFPSEWIGVNLLGVSITNLKKFDLSGVSGLWTDNAKIDPDRENPNTEAHSFKRHLESEQWDGLYFGGTAFKGPLYMDNFLDCAYVAIEASEVMDVVTTSGPRTGVPPPLQKILAMRAALRNFPLANASGIDKMNIHQYLHYVDCFLVASGINIPDKEDLDPILTKELADIIHHTAQT